MDPVAEWRESLPRQREGVRVAVEADERELRETLEEGLGVTAEAEGGVDEHGAGPLEGGREQLDGALEQTGMWMRSSVHECPGFGPSGLIPIRCDLAPGK